MMKRDWYQHLAQTGFDDIEKNEEELKTTSSSHQAIHDMQSPITFEARLDYFLWAQRKNDSTFDSLRDKMIWQYHSEGLFSSEIAPRVGLERTWISRNLKRIEHYLKDSVRTISSSLTQSYCQNF